MFKQSSQAQPPTPQQVADDFVKQVERKAVGGVLNKAAKYKAGQLRELLDGLHATFIQQAGFPCKDFVIGTLKNLTGVRLPFYLKHARSYVPEVADMVSVARNIKGVTKQTPEPELIKLVSSRWAADRDRKHAAELLGQSTNPQALEVLCVGLYDCNYDIREQCLTSIGLIGGVKAVPFLVAGLREPYHTTREGALTGLQKTCDYGGQSVQDLVRAQAPKRLLRILRRDQYFENRALAAEILGTLGVEEAVPHLINAISRRPRIIGWSYEKTGRQGEFMNAHSDEEHQRKFIQILGEFGANTQDTQLRQQIVTALVSKIIQSNATYRRGQDDVPHPHPYESDPTTQVRVHRTASQALYRVFYKDTGNAGLDTINAIRGAMKYLADKCPDLPETGQLRENWRRAGEILGTIRDEEQKRLRGRSGGER